MEVKYLSCKVVVVFMFNFVQSWIQCCDYFSLGKEFGMVFLICH